MRRTIATVIGIFIISNASAIQTYNVKNGSEVSAKIYASGLSRISLQDDRISAIKGVAGEFLIDKNEDLGDIYIKPLSTRSSETMDLFISSEKGNTYSLRLTPSSDHPESISLVASDLVFNEPNNSNGGNSTQRSGLIEIIKQASTGSDIRGFSTEVFSEPSKLKLKNNVISVIEKTHTGRDYKIEVLRIENNLHKTISVKEKDLVTSSDVVAISLETSVLPEGTFTKAYRVIRL